MNQYDSPFNVRFSKPIIIDNRSKTVSVEEYEQYVEFNGKMARGWTLHYKPELDLNKLSLCRILECIINARLKDNDEAEARLIPLWDKKLAACKGK